MKKLTIISTREYVDGRLEFRKLEVIRTKDDTPPVSDTRVKVSPFKSND